MERIRQQRERKYAQIVCGSNKTRWEGRRIQMGFWFGRKGAEGWKEVLDVTLSLILATELLLMKTIEIHRMHDAHVMNFKVRAIGNIGGLFGTTNIIGVGWAIFLPRSVPHFNDCERYWMATLPISVYENNLAYVRYTFLRKEIDFARGETYATVLFYKQYPKKSEVVYRLKRNGRKSFEFYAWTHFSCILSVKDTSRWSTNNRRG